MNHGTFEHWKENRDFLSRSQEVFFLDRDQLQVLVDYRNALYASRLLLTRLSYSREKMTRELDQLDIFLIENGVEFQETMY